MRAVNVQMNSFNKMVQTKRSKMLILTVLLTVTIFIQQTTGINLTYIVKKEGEKLQPNCIADENERYSAIGWVYPLATNKEKDPKITTKFIPTILNDFNCKFSKSDKCNKIWSLKNWELDEKLDLLFDNRWEDFPVIFTGNGSKEFEDRIEIPKVFKAGFSLRTQGSVELLLCEGWNPYNYPCYHFNISKNDIFFRKYGIFPKNASNSDRILDTYKAFANIVSDDEWRNFVVNLDDKGVLSLIDVSVNRTVIQYQDKTVLKPLYLLVRSAQPALWKIHQNQFIYTKKTQTSRLGPTLNLPSKELCVAFYASTCPTCIMTFFIVKNTEKKYLVEVKPSKNFEWKLVKLKDNNIQTDKVNIFVETKFSENSEETEGFWAVDEVRVCQENEVKVSFLKWEDDENNEELAEEIACQVVQHPKWRPKKLVYEKIQDFPTVDNSSNSTSISLNWTQEDPQNQINYFISYQANDLCPPELPNLKRIKSNGFLMTKHNEITINNLIPYTNYNITFSSMLHENEKEIVVTTRESPEPTLEEIPTKLNIQVTDAQAYASWDKIQCSSIYGPILYAIKVTNLKSNITKDVGVQMENTVEINDLEPFTLYTFQVIAGRTFEDLQNNRSTVKINGNFTTQPGKAPPIENLEMYSIDRNSVSFRYDLPKNSKGVPVKIQVTRCNVLSFGKCKTLTYDIQQCKLWRRKYCLTVSNLIPEQNYTFKISLKNQNTQFYGDEVKVETYLEEKIPGPPTHLNYSMVDCKEALDYCHLNITWLHPYDQNGTINFFHIILNATDQGNTKDIQEIFNIFNSSYSPKYEYQIQYIPYSTHYELYVQSANSKYKSPFTHTHVKTDDIGSHINQSLILLETRVTSVTFKLPPLDHRLKSYTLTPVVQDFNQDKAIPDEIKRNGKVFQHLCHKNFGDTWILPKVVVSDSETKTIDIGSSDSSNRYLEPNSSYCFIFIVTNRYRDTEHDVVYVYKLRTKGQTPVVTEKGYTHLWALLLLLLLIPIGFLTYRCFKKRRPRKPRQPENKENVYESLPFEECEENCVTNDTYDHLLHK